jgi:hypothetical protein
MHLDIHLYCSNITVNLDLQITYNLERSEYYIYIYVHSNNYTLRAYVFFSDKGKSFACVDMFVHMCGFIYW